MRSIALTVKKMSTHKISQAKMGILQLVTNLQMVEDDASAFGNALNVSSTLINKESDLYTYV